MGGRRAFREGPMDGGTHARILAHSREESREVWKWRGRKPEIDNDNTKEGKGHGGKFEHSWDQSESLKLPSNGQQELK